ncbi:DUF4893 domain-containing protein [Lysobacter humi (ex Lee et al. 2017)]
MHRASARFALFVLAAVLAMGPAAAGGGGTWRRQVHADDIPRIERALALAERVRPEQGAYPEDFARARELLRRAARPQPLGDVVGRWRVRSLQVNAHGTFAYPFFAASIARDGARLRFAKTSGSQRRSGLLLPSGDGRSLAFIGGATVNDEPPVAYSRIDDPGAAPRESDSVGRLVRIGPRELLLVLDPAPDRYELYHLAR